jgi:hypothetical protein
MPRKPLDNERRHDKLFCYGEEVPQVLLSALRHKIMPPEARCQEDRGINAEQIPQLFRVTQNNPCLKVYRYSYF